MIARVDGLESLIRQYIASGELGRVPPGRALVPCFGETSVDRVAVDLHRAGRTCIAARIEVFQGVRYGKLEQLGGLPNINVALLEELADEAIFGGLGAVSCDELTKRAEGLFECGPGVEAESIEVLRENSQIRAGEEPLDVVERGVQVRNGV